MFELQRLKMQTFLKNNKTQQKRQVGLTIWLIKECFQVKVLPITAIQTEHHTKHD